jgi:hypothetical protein
MLLDEHVMGALVSRMQEQCYVFVHDKEKLSKFFEEDSDLVIKQEPRKPLPLRWCHFHLGRVHHRRRVCFLPDMSPSLRAPASPALRPQVQRRNEAIQKRDRLAKANSAMANIQVQEPHMKYRS